MSDSLNVSDMTRAATEAAREHTGFELVGISLAGGTDYAEVLLRVRDSADADPRMVSLGVFRDVSPAELRSEISSRLRHHTEQSGL